MVPCLNEFRLGIQELLEFWVSVLIKPLVLGYVHDVVLRKRWSATSRWQDLLDVVILPEV